MVEPGRVMLLNDEAGPDWSGQGVDVGIPEVVWHSGDATDLTTPSH
jgi:hypothetical protein